MGIRIAKRADVEAMRQIYAPYVEHTAYSYEYETPDYAEFLDRFERCTAQFPWLVWEENGEVLGYVYASPAFSRKAYGFLADLSIYLREDVRGNGIGRQLYRAAEEILRRQGYCRIYCIVTSANTGSLLFHEAMGYRKLAVFARSGMKFGRWYDTTWYEKILRESDEALPFPVSWREVRLDDLF